MRWHLLDIWKFVSKSKIWIERELEEEVAVLDCFHDCWHIFSNAKPPQDLGCFIVGPRSQDTEQIFVGLAFDLEIGQLAFLGFEVGFCRKGRVFAGSLSFDAD